MSSRRPSCSIIIPTRGRPAQLASCLDALAGISYSDFEVVVVDDNGGRDDLERVLAQFRDRLQLKLHVQDTRGPAAARNAGAERARGALLAFTDDDCRPAADWLERLAEVTTPIVAAGGHTVNALPHNPFASTSQLVIDIGYRQNNGVRDAARFFTSNNLLVPARGFHEVGGFDPSFITSEDRDFCDRWIAHGYSLTYAPAALVYHAHDLTFRGFVKQQFAYGRGAARYHRAHGRRWNRRVTIEPSFYLRLFRYPFEHERGREMFRQTALLQLWNLVNLGGFGWELARTRVGTLRRVSARPASTREATLDGLAGCDVLHVVWPGDYNGVLTHVDGYVRAARSPGGLDHRVCFLEGRGAVADGLAKEGIAYRLGFRRGWGPIGLWRFARSLRAARPQVVHFHWRAFGAIMVAAAMLPRTPFVWTEHHPDVVLGSRQPRIFYRFLKRRFARFVVTSDAMAAYVARYGVDRRRIDVIPNALTIPLSPPEPRREQQQPVVGVVTRIDDRKRVDLFIDVIAELRRRKVQCSGLIVGDGDPRAELEAYARQSGLARAVRFVGMKRDVAGWLDRFSVFLSTSTVDTFGLASLEAMARGVPVVAMPCPGGLSELARRGGVLLEDRDRRTAADAIQSLLASDEARFEVAQRGYDVALGHTMAAAVERHDQMYRALGVEPARPESLPVAT
jgi:glycosyltransferase involved in cell wall biosynthesis/GT2 family glycosyltransferase